jgi:hypothetical protein
MPARFDHQGDDWTHDAWSLVFDLEGIPARGYQTGTARFLGKRCAMRLMNNKPSNENPLIDGPDIAALKAQVLASGLTVSQLVSTGLGIALDVPRL